LRGSGHRRHPLLQDRHGSRAEGRPPRAVGVPDEVAARAVVGRDGASAAGAFHRRRGVAGFHPVLQVARGHDGTLGRAHGRHRMIVISRTGRLLRRLVRLSCRRPVVTTVVSLLLAVAGVTYTVRTLTFGTSGRDLLPRDAGYIVRYNQYAREFGELEDIVIVI